MTSRMRGRCTATTFTFRGLRVITAQAAEGEVVAVHLPRILEVIYQEDQGRQGVEQRIDGGRAVTGFGDDVRMLTSDVVERRAL